MLSEKLLMRKLLCRTCSMLSSVDLSRLASVCWFPFWVVSACRVRRGLGGGPEGVGGASVLDALGLRSAVY